MVNPYAKDISLSNQVPKLDIRSVSKHYRSVTAVDDVSLALADGEFMTLLGPSGSGKTTLLSMVAGLAVPDKGEVWIEGKQSTYLPTHKRDIGMVFQNYALFPHLSVFENIAFPLRMRRVSEVKIREAVCRVLEVIELPDVGDRLPRQLSGGQQQRVALARCMVYEPSITIMDEPLGALDKGLRDAMQLEIKRLHQRLGITVLYVTHDQEEALALSDRICLMRNGRAEQISTPDDLYFAPQSVFAAKFIGDSTLVKGTITNRNGNQIAISHSGGTIIANAKKCEKFHAVGSNVVAMIRPENIRISEVDENRDNSITGKVESILFVGSVVNIYLRSPDGTEFQCKLLTTRQTASQFEFTDLTMSWNSDDVIVLDPDPSIDV